MIEKFTLTLAYLMMTGVFILLFRRFRQASPVFWGPIAQSLMAVGTIAFIDPRSGVDLYYIFLYFLSIISFTITAALYMSNFRVSADLYRFMKSRTSATHYNAVLLTVALFAVSVLVTIIYYSAIGYNMVFLLFSDGGISDYSTLRIATYSGEDYFAPGYVNQFKNVLLPITAACIGYWLWRRPKRVAFYVFLACTVPFVFVALAGTGQRGYLVFTAAALLFGSILHNIGRPVRMGPLRAAVLAVPVFLLFGLMTVAYNERGDQSVLQVAGDILSRFTSIQQESGLIGFRYIYLLETTWFTEWGKSFAGFVPGVEGSRLAQDLHALLYGTDRGTVPPSAVASAYYNGGIVGVGLLFLILGQVSAALYRQYLRGPREIIRSMSYGFVFFYLSVFVSDTPAILVDNGVLTALLFVGLAKLSGPRPWRQSWLDKPEPVSRRSAFRADVADHSYELR